jgi:hypothetical protein
MKKLKMHWARSMAPNLVAETLTYQKLAIQDLALAAAVLAVVDSVVAVAVAAAALVVTVVLVAAATDLLAVLVTTSFWFDSIKDKGLGITALFFGFKNPAYPV